MTILEKKQELLDACRRLTRRSNSSTCRWRLIAVSASGARNLGQWEDIDRSKAIAAYCNEAHGKRTGAVGLYDRDQDRLTFYRTS